jgi:hypothetical protein
MGVVPHCGTGLLIFHRQAVQRADTALQHISNCSRMNVRSR